MQPDDSLRTPPLLAVAVARPHTPKNQDIHRSAEKSDFIGFILAGIAFLSGPGSLEGFPGVRESPWESPWEWGWPDPG